MSELYNVSSSPHVRSKDTTSRIMLYVIIALLPTSIFGIYNFGYKALVLILVTIATCVVSEWVYNKIVHKKSTITDLSAVVTGLLLALNLPATLPWWQAVIGGAFAIIVVKCLFGGLGQNFMNPALGARCFLLIAFAANMTNFTIDSYSGATPLAAIRNGEAYNTMDMLIGRTAGTIGETCTIAILLGAIFLILMGVIDLRIPGTYIVTFVIFMLLFGGHGLDANYIGTSCRRRSDVRRFLYGDRLCDISDYAGRKDFIRCLSWCPDWSVPLLWSKCRRRIFCNYFKQPACTDD